MVEEVAEDMEMGRRHHLAAVAEDVGVDLLHQSIFVLKVPTTVSLVHRSQLAVLLWHLGVWPIRAGCCHLSS